MNNSQLTVTHCPSLCSRQNKDCCVITALCVLDLYLPFTSANINKGNIACFKFFFIMILYNTSALPVGSMFSYRKVGGSVAFSWMSK